MHVSKTTYRTVVPLVNPRRALAVFRKKMQFVKLYEAPKQKILVCSGFEPAAAALSTNDRQMSESMPL
jgi:hypothetical protein